MARTKRVAEKEAQGSPQPTLRSSRGRQGSPTATTETTTALLSNTSVPSPQAISVPEAPSQDDQVACPVTVALEAELLAEKEDNPMDVTSASLRGGVRLSISGGMTVHATITKDQNQQGYKRARYV